MISEAQRTAARQNGRLSHGPITDQGKRNSSRNSLRHGILAQTVVLDSEDAEAFRALLSDLESEHEPEDETEPHDGRDPT